MASNRTRVLSGSIAVGDYITTDKPTDVWWKVEGIAEKRDGTRLLTREFAVINKGGYRKTIPDTTGAGRRFYRWTPAR